MAKTNNGANLGFEEKLWAAADKLRGHMDASEYKHVVLGLIFLKYISDAFQEKYDELECKRKTEYTDPEDRDEYSASNIFWVPKEARWARLQAGAKQPIIGKLIDDAMVAMHGEVKRTLASTRTFLAFARAQLLKTSRSTAMFLRRAVT